MSKLPLGKRNATPRATEKSHEPNDLVKPDGLYSKMKSHCQLFMAGALNKIQEMRFVITTMVLLGSFSLSSIVYHNGVVKDALVLDGALYMPVFSVGLIVFIMKRYSAKPWRTKVKFGGDDKFDPEAYLVMIILGNVLKLLIVTLFEDSTVWFQGVMLFIASLLSSLTFCRAVDGNDVLNDKLMNWVWQFIPAVDLKSFLEYVRKVIESLLVWVVLGLVVGQIVPLLTNLTTMKSPVSFFRVLVISHMALDHIVVRHLIFKGRLSLRIPDENKGGKRLASSAKDICKKRHAYKSCRAYENVSKQNLIRTFSCVAGIAMGVFVLRMSWYSIRFIAPWTLWGGVLLLELVLWSCSSCSTLLLTVLALRVGNFLHFNLVILMLALFGAMDSTMPVESTSSMLCEFFSRNALSFNYFSNNFGGLVASFIVGYASSRVASGESKWPFVVKCVTPYLTLQMSSFYVYQACI